ncbi:pyridoxine 5'-phosphate synthase [Helicobacter marmotae]|uniref:Pyridoxine 5'-phosphate synthase n=1 Tax=Helicobacter marmotae TaxID=152490 RepID=A0A3D8I838_9HELI|nr:pyridoxine 5'-phosphate synthase [Helicobacter marmotae]RDU61185.1 pyridoxine 5'-phosphate synthase [Helicobacter marmotae]
MTLGVNIDHIATLREARAIYEPDPLEAVFIAKNAGAGQITLHLREDKRHIHDSDVKRIVQSSPLPVNIESALDEKIIDYLCALKPQRITLVPEKREEVTTEGGLDIESHYDSIRDTLKAFESAGIASALFIDPKKESIFLARELGADAVELHTGRYANLCLMAYSNLSRTHRCIKDMNLPLQEQVKEIEKCLMELRECANLATSSIDTRSLKCFAGHGLNYQNVAQIASIPHITELNIGHSIIARAVFVGLERAIIQMREAMCLK